MEYSIMVKGVYVSEIYRWYDESILMVNRKYQRKLVWTLEEKRQFIDTIIKEYPVPLFLFVDSKEKCEEKEEERPYKEIIDGLQRLEAIISFISNEYAIVMDGKFKYFDIDTLPGSAELLKEGKLKQKHPKIDFNICRDFLIYELPATTIEANSGIVEDIFKRINSTGRKLSLQNLRQAGATGLFGNLVRQTSAKIRGDYTKKDVINLNEMSKYSLNSKGLDYGINIENVFWIKNGIITEDGIRRSKDEEIIANIYNCILNNYTTSISSNTLDRVYDEGNNQYSLNENALSNGKASEISNLFLTVYDDLEKILDKKKSTFSSLLFKRNKSYNKDLVFIIIFLSLIQLRNENYVIENYLKVGNALKEIADKELSEIISKSDCGWSIDLRTRLIDRIKNCLNSSMVFKESNPEWNRGLIDLLKRAEVEEQMYDFKMGMTTLKLGEFNQEMVDKCVKTLIAMANAYPRKEGVVVFGLSDNEKDAIDFGRYYKVEPVKYNNYYVTGIKDEAIKHFGNVDNYMKTIKNLIEEEKDKVSETVISDILTTIEIARYNDRVLLVMRLSAEQPLFYDKKLYIRHQSHNTYVETGSDEFYNILKKFR